MIERTCEAVVLDEHDREVTCGGTAVAKVGDWWRCEECFSNDALEPFEEAAE